MKKALILLLVALAGVNPTIAQETGYQPLVREGIRWHYFKVYLDQVNKEACIMSFQGDSIVNGVQYKKCIEEDCYGQQTVVALVREKDQVVYSIGGSTANILPGEYVGEIILYDFNNPIRMFPEDVFYEFEQSTIDIEGISHNCYTCDYGNNKIIEGIGIDGSGTLINLEFAIYTSTNYQYTGLSYVEENGDIIYKGSAYEEPTHYQPLVREGVRWINRSYLVFEDTIINPHYYGIEISGDTVINNNGNLLTYKKCYSFAVNKDDCNVVIDFSKRFPDVYLREVDKKVYCTDYFAVRLHKQPIILYDFSDLDQAILGDRFDEQSTEVFTLVGTETVCGHECRAFTDGVGYFSFGKLVESIGLVSSYMGDLVNARWLQFAGEMPEELYGLSHVIDAAGNIIYNGPNYLFFASDINGDNKVDIADVNEVINVMLGKSAATADVTGDGKVDISDVNAVINAMLGK